MVKYPIEFEISSDSRFGSAFLAKLVFDENAYDLEFCPVIEGNKYHGKVLVESAGYYVYRYYAGSRKYHGAYYKLLIFKENGEYEELATIYVGTEGKSFEAVNEQYEKILKIAYAKTPEGEKSKPIYALYKLALELSKSKLAISPKTKEAILQKVESKIQQFLLVDVVFPSIAIFQKRAIWSEEGIRIGYKISELLPRAFINKLKNLYNEFLERYNEITMVFGIGELRLRVMPPDRIVEFDKLIRETQEKLQKLAENIISFVDEGKVDETFMKAYADREGNLNAEKLREDYANFWRKINIIVRNIEDANERRKIVEEIVNDIKKKAMELVDRFGFFVVNASLDASAILSNIKYKTKKEIEEKASKTLLEIFETSKKRLEDAYVTQLNELFKKLLKVLSSSSNDIIDLVIQKLSRYEYFDFIKNIITKLRSMRGKAPILRVIETIEAFRQEIINSKEQIIKEMTGKVLEKERERILKRLEKIEKSLTLITNNIRKQIQRNIVELENLAKVGNDTELLEAIERLKDLDFKAMETVAKRSNDPEISRIVTMLLSEELELE